MGVVFGLFFHILMKCQVQSWHKMGYFFLRMGCSFDEYPRYPKAVSLFPINFAPGFRAGNVWFHDRSSPVPVLHSLLIEMFKTAHRYKNATWRWSEQTCHWLTYKQLADWQLAMTDWQTCNLQIHHYTFWDMNYFLVLSFGPVTPDRQTDRKRCIRAHHA